MRGQFLIDKNKIQKKIIQKVKENLGKKNQNLKEDSKIAIKFNDSMGDQSI